MTGRAEHTATLLTMVTFLLPRRGAAGLVAAAELYVPDTLTPPSLAAITVTHANPSIAGGQPQSFTARTKTGNNLPP